MSLWTQWVQSLFQPAQRSSFDSVDAWRRQHDETSRNLRTGINSMLVLSLYCVATLANSPESALLTPNAEIRLPIAGISLPFEAFLTLAPMSLVFIQLYLHRMYTYKLSLIAPPSDTAEEVQQLPFLVNQDDFGARTYGLFMLYWLAPLTLVMFAWEAAPRVEGVFLSILSATVAVILLVLRIRHTHGRATSWFRTGRRFLMFVVLIGFAGIALFSENPLNHGLDLKNTDLTQTKLDAGALDDLNLVQSLREAQFDWSDLRGVEFINTDMRDSFFYNTQLGGAVFTFADLRGANFASSYAKHADFSFADLRGAVLALRDYEGIDFLFAKLEGTAIFTSDNLTCEQLKRATDWELSHRKEELACGAPIPPIGQ